MKRQLILLTFLSSIALTACANVKEKSLLQLTYEGTPLVTNYIEGDSFDPSGLTVKATYSDSTIWNVTKEVKWVPEKLAASDTSVIGKYTYSGTTKTVVVPGITVKKADKIVNKDRTNPFIDLDMPDPTIIRSNEDGYFYIFSTEGRVYYDGEHHEKAIIPIFKSKDMVKYEYVGPVFDTTPTWNYGTEGIWAPDVIRYNNKYYCYYTCGVYSGDTINDAIGVATATSLDGEWTDHGKIIDGHDTQYGSFWKGSAMDQCVVEHEGKLYMFFGSFGGIYYLPLTEDGLHIVQGSKATLVIGGALGTTRNGDYEGAFIRKMNGHWYFTGSHGTCCAGTNSTYGVYAMVSKTDTPFGPYIFYNPNTRQEVEGYHVNPKTFENSGNYVLGGYQYGTTGNQIGNLSGTGHNALFSDDLGNWYILYHGYVRNKNGIPHSYNKGRILFYDKLEWDTSYPIAMPYVNGVVKYASSFDYEEDFVKSPSLYV